MATAVASEQSAPPAWRLRLPERLPEISGWGLIAYRLVWAISAVLVLATVAASYRTELSNQARITALYGTGIINFGTYADGMHVSPFGSQARAAGVQNDDVLLEVNGKPPPIDDDGAVTRLFSGRDGTRVSLMLRGTDGRIRVVVLTRSSSYLRDAYAGSGLTLESRRWLQFVIATVGQLLLLAAATLLFLRRPRDPVAALLSLGFVINLIGVPSLFGNTMGIVANCINTTSVLLILLGVLFFPDGRLAPRWWPLPAILILLAQIAVFATYWTPMLSFPAQLFQLGVAALGIAAVISRYRKLETGAARQQMKFGLLGFAAVLVFAILNAGFSEAGRITTDETVRPWLFLGLGLTDSLQGIAGATGLLVALLRYRLYDADSVIGRSAAYGILTVGFVGLFAGAEKLAEIVGERYFEHSIGIAAGAVGAAVAATCIVPLHNRVHRWAERRFQKPLVRLREGLPECVADLRESASRDQLVEEVMRRIRSGVRSTHEAVLLADHGKLLVAGAHGLSAKALREWQSGWRPQPGHDSLDCDRRDAIFPLRVRLCIETGDEPEMIGWLLIGPRPDGSFFGKDERETLEHIAGPVARAIHIAQLHERRDAQAEKRLSTLEALIEKVAAAIGGMPTASAAN